VACLSNPERFGTQVAPIVEAETRLTAEVP